MTDQPKYIDSIIHALQERAKELNCLYKVEEILNTSIYEPDKIYQSIVDSIPPGWQYPEICSCKLIIEDKIYSTSNLKETQWHQQADIFAQDNLIGSVNVYYAESRPLRDRGPFLKEEEKLINTIAERIGHFVLHHKLKSVFESMEETGSVDKASKQSEWKIVLNLLKDTDPLLYKLIARKMMNHLCWNGIKEAEKLLLRSNRSIDSNSSQGYLDENRPLEKSKLYEISPEIFRIAEENLSDDEILYRIEKWIQEDKSSFLVRTLENLDTTLPEIEDVIHRFMNIESSTADLPRSTEKGIIVSLSRRILTDQLPIISIAKDYVEIKDFYDILQRMIYPPKSHGKLGGKSVGLFIAEKVLRKEAEQNPILKDIKIPKTWYITSDTVIDFIHYNNLEEVIEQKYKDIDQIRQEYPYFVQVFKNSSFPPEIVKGFSLALDDLGDKPLIVRSSSLLEDSMSAAFSGKYKSLFVANQGTKQQRMTALMDAISEVYASVFSPDPIEYRAERGLLDFNEEMGIMIQEVVGTRIGKYYLPTYAGVAFSNNEFRWSPRINREDGLIRLVPGLGTRAVDRIPNDYPILIAPGKPGLRVNVSVDDIVKYAPREIDVINLEKNRFETIEINSLLRYYGSDYPFVTDIVSSFDHGQIRKIIELDVDYDRDSLVVTFDRLISNTSFVKKVHTVLNVLKEKLNTPLDIEFASDGHHFYLLQARPQSYAEESKPSPIPKDIENSRIIFTANKYISNGKVPDVSHIVYVDPDAYSDLQTHAELVSVGKAIGKLNKLLPKRQFILMGPGRWGSRGDIRLGVNVTYSDINNSAVLIEIAKKKGNYLPDLSFGTHFFQDLVEASIRYLPLYPDDERIIFNEKFLKKSTNILPDILPEYSSLSNVVKVIDIKNSGNGQILKILMNTELSEAIGYLKEPSTEIEIAEQEQVEYVEYRSEDYWRWRLRMVEKIASKLDGEKFGVKGFYVFGSTKNATAGPGSDIDIIIHFCGNKLQQEELQLWLEGWSLCLAELNYLRTGYHNEKMLDVHFISDDDIKDKSSFSMKIGAVTDPAKELQMKSKLT